ncbi:hypothetical protein CRN32_18095 [Vibrio vulnificus]|uniref:hypothetical protein n=1 Tax=Vibrio vulnificus TaxID=672 RepID=UPI000CD0F3E5|nr:hypothetical protein [Vibrio vulnificus]EJC6733697.1 hypothetical protein [Vibrio vulnificus]POC50176.1 hypothetical protein CRN32_18095 [Vibrio vulnificus]RZQ91819.1 hypothetical protein D8T27_01000 [Vibrio vulnificus]
MNNILKIIAFILALSGGFFAKDIVQLFASDTTAVTQSAPQLEDYCMLSTQACTQQAVSMTLSNDTAQPLVASEVRVEWHSSKEPQLVLTLSGLEMDMGKPKFVLKQTSPGNYSGEVILPVCTTDAMTWLGELTDGTTTVYPAIRMQR